MSQVKIRAALEKRLAAMGGALATAYQNAPFNDTAGVPYQRADLIPATPDNSMAGMASYFEQGIFQVTLCYPIEAGPNDAELMAETIRLWYRRGTTLVESGVQVNIIKTPRVSPAFVLADRYNVPVSISYQAQVATP
jgi:hypothetical protein